jgi:hypothetical protein
MEGLRNSLLVPAGSSVFMIMGCLQAMQAQAVVRYTVKDENGKMLLPHPYAPWIPVPKEYQSKADDAYRAFKMYENVKEWALISIPLMWTSFVFCGGLPCMNQARAEALIAITTAVYMYGNNVFIKGYLESADARLQGFQLRKNVVISWILISIVSMGYTALKRFGVFGDLRMDEF